MRDPIASKDAPRNPCVRCWTWIAWMHYNHHTLYIILFIPFPQHSHVVLCVWYLTHICGTRHLHKGQQRAGTLCWTFWRSIEQRRQHQNKSHKFTLPLPKGDHQSITLFIVWGDDCISRSGMNRWLMNLASSLVIMAHNKMSSLCHAAPTND